MVFCHLGQLSSVRDISNGLRSITGNIVHLGCTQAPYKSSISYINERRPSRIFEEFYYALAAHFRAHVRFAKPALRQIRRKVYLLDASVISLSLSLYDWARFRSRKGAVKLHLLLDYKGCQPAFANLTRGNVADITATRGMSLPSGSILVFDMGYYDFSWWNKLDSMNTWFVTRSKYNLDYELVEDFDVSGEKDRNVLQDSNIRLTGVKSQHDYPRMFRRVR